MSRLSEVLDEAKRHKVTLKNRNGKTLFTLSLLWAVIIVVAAPQALVALLILAVLEIVDVEFDGRQLGVEGSD